MHTENDIVHVICRSKGRIPFIVQGPRMTPFPILFFRYTALKSMGYDIELVPNSSEAKEVDIEDATIAALNEAQEVEPLVVDDAAIAALNEAQEVEPPVVDEEVQEVTIPEATYVELDSTTASESSPATEAEEEITVDELNTHTEAELKEILRQNNIKYPRTAKKAKLVEIIMAASQA